MGEWAPIAENVKITLDGDLITKNATLTGSYEFTDVNEDKEGESLLRWYSADTENGKYTLISEKKKSDNVNTYTLTEKDMNKYIKFAVVPVSERVPYNGDEVFSQCIAGFFEPVAETVAITGKAELGEKLSAQYLYTDRNGYTEISPKYRWYRQKDNEKPVIIDGEESAEYIVSENDSDCGIIVGITLTKAGYDGSEVLSEAVMGLYAPSAENVKINGTAKQGQTLYVSYSFSDKNEDEEGETKITWYKDGKEFETGKSITVTKAMIGSMVWAEVTPISKEYPFEGKPTKSASVKISSGVISGGGSGGGSAAPIPAGKTDKNENNENNEVNMPQTPAGNSEKNGFSDISGHWAEQTIKDMHEKGYISGISKNLFAPEENVTRAQFAKMTANIFEIEQTENKMIYNDVDEADWYYEAVLKMTSNGLMTGYNGNFNPNDYITRQEIAVVIMNIAKHYEVFVKTEGSAEFTDYAEIADWAAEAVDYAAKEGIIMGKNGNLFAPKDNATRAESITMIKRLQDKIGENRDEK